MEIEVIQMPKVILEFNLPEENVDFQAAILGLNWALVAWDLDVDLRNWIKYGHPFTSADEALDAIRERLLRLMDAHGVSFDTIP